VQTWLCSCVCFGINLPDPWLTIVLVCHRNTHEAYFYVFEGVVMLANSVMLNAMHPGRLLPQDSRVYLALDGVTELKGPGWRDPRRWWWQVMDPFDFAGCCRRDAKYDFWNHPEPAGNEGGDAVLRVESEAGKVEESAASESNNSVAAPGRGVQDRSLWLRAVDPLRLFSAR